MSFRHTQRPRIAAVVLTLSIGAAPRPLGAQYPLAPTPVLSLGTLSAEPRFSGYVSVRETVRDDTATFVVNRARLTVQVLPATFVALRMQGDFSAVGRTNGDTVPAFTLTDAYVDLTLPDSVRLPGALRPALVVGQFRTPFSLEYLTPFSLLHSANRSQAVDRLSTRRDIGVLGQLAVGRLATVTGAVVNGEGPNRTSNPDGRQMIVSRLTVFLARSLGMSVKWLAQGRDHRWGYDARWIAGRVVLEGEVIERSGAAAPAASTDADGGYLLISYRALRWLQPVVKWERLRETTTVGGGSATTRLIWQTYGINLLAPQDRVRFQLNWVVKSERPIDRSNELIAQLQGIF